MTTNQDQPITFETYFTQPMLEEMAAQGMIWDENKKDWVPEHQAARTEEQREAQRQADEQRNKEFFAVFGMEPPAKPTRFPRLWRVEMKLDTMNGTKYIDHASFHPLGLTVDGHDLFLVEVEDGHAPDFLEMIQIDEDILSAREIPVQRAK